MTGSRMSVERTVDSALDGHTTLYGRWLLLARVAWMAVALLAVGIFIAGLPFSYDEAVTVCVRDDCHAERLLPEDAEALRDLGLSESFYAGYITGLVSVFALSFTLVGALIFWRRSNDWMAMLVSLALVSFGTSWTDVPRSLATANPEWRFAYTFILDLGFTSLFLLFYLFPDGRFVANPVACCRFRRCLRRRDRVGFAPHLGWAGTDFPFIPTGDLADQTEATLVHLGALVKRATNPLL